VTIHSFPMHKHMHTHILCACVCAHITIPGTIQQTTPISYSFISNMRIHLWSVPWQVHFNPNLPQFFSLRYLNLYQMLMAYGLLPTLSFRFTIWQLMRNLTFNKQDNNVPLNAKYFCLNGKTVSCNGHLKRTVLSPQQKTWHLKGCKLKVEIW
jgi:hypothetical protein